MTSLTDRKNAAISRGVGMTTQVYAERAENAEIWDRDGRRYIDFAASIAASEAVPSTECGSVCPAA